MPPRPYRPATVLAAALLSLGAFAGLAATDPPTPAERRAHDRSVWQELLSDAPRIRRTVRHLDRGVEATTESDDPEVAARIVEHARAMQARLADGSPVRMWDPVFAELFRRHDRIRIEVTPTGRGVSIVETSDDPEVVALLRAHALGVSDFVREGHAAARRTTTAFPADAPLPVPELALGGVRHRFLLAAPDAERLVGLEAAGVTTVLSFRPASETPGFDPRAAAAAAGLDHLEFPFGHAGELDDGIIDGGRGVLAAAERDGRVVALHCRTGNRAGPAWAAYRVLDAGIPAGHALAEARAMGMADPLLESAVRDYLRRRSPDGEGAGWSDLAPEDRTDERVAQEKEAIAARDLMFGRLFAALGTAMQGEEGTVGAIRVCKDLAPKIAREVARERDLLIGRTSVRLRNPANTAPAWAKPILAGMPEGPRTVVHPDGSLGVTLPIRLAGTCLACHGDPAEIAPEVRQALGESYPRDQAVGFAEGDLRGWFWIEVPPRTRASTP